MVFVRVGCDQESKVCDPMAAQIGLNSSPHVLGAGVDENVLTGKLEQFRVSLADIQEVHGEILARRNRDGNQQECEKGYLQEPLKIGIFQFVPSGGPYISLRI